MCSNKGGNVSRREKLVLIIVFNVAVIASIGFWFVARSINYKLSYEDMVKQTVIELVREEALK